MREKEATVETFLLHIVLYLQRTKVVFLCSVRYLILGQWRVVFVGQTSFDERRQRLGPPLSHPGVRVLADLRDTSHRHTYADTCARRRQM